MDDLSGPEHIAVHGNRVLVTTPHSLVELRADGTLQGGLELADLGFSGSVSGLQVLSDGRVLLGDFNARRVLGCDVTQRRCEPIGPNDAEVIGRAFRFYWDETSARLYLLDGDRHRLLVQEGVRGPIRQLDSSVVFDYPNDFVVGDGGLIHVADTGHRRIVALELSGHALKEKGKTFPTHHPQGGAGRSRPVGLSRDAAGRWWVLNTNRYFQNADMVSYDPEGTPLFRVALPEDADPYALAATATRILVTDPGRVTIEAIDPVTGAVSAFGDAPLQDWLRSLRATREPFQAVASGALWGIVLWPGVVMGCGIYVLCERSRRRLNRGRPMPPLLAKNLAGDVRWLAPDPTLMAERRRSARVLSLALCVAPLGFLMAQSLRDPRRLTAILTGKVDLVVLSSGLMLALLVGMVWFNLRPGRSLLGARGSLLCLGDSDQRVFVVPPEDVVHANSALAFGPVTLPLRAVSRNRRYELLYPAGDFERVIQPLLDRAQIVREIDLFVYQLLQRQAGALAVAGAAIVGPVLFVLMLAMSARY